MRVSGLGLEFRISNRGFGRALITGIGRVGFLGFRVHNVNPKPCFEGSFNSVCKAKSRDGGLDQLSHGEPWVHRRTMEAHEALARHSTTEKITPSYLKINVR